MELFNRLYKTLANESELSSDIPKIIKDECFLFMMNIESEIIDGYEYLILNPYQLQNFIKLQRLTGVFYNLEDISEDVMIGTFETEDVAVKEFCHKFETMEKSVDHVLEKISKLNGVENLSDYDRKLLAKH